MKSERKLKEDDLLRALKEMHKWDALRKHCKHPNPEFVVSDPASGWDVYYCRVCKQKYLG